MLLTRPPAAKPQAYDNVAARQKLKIQFAKADKNHDGFLSQSEFQGAVRSCAVSMPNLNTVPAPILDVQYATHATPTGIDIRGFLKVLFS